MTTRKYEEHHIRKISKMGDTSRRMTVPTYLLKELGWREGQKVTVKKWGNGILIQDWEE